MDRDRIREIADEIERLPLVGGDAPYHNGDRDIEQFNMSCYHFDCGSPACIAGHVVAKYSGQMPGSFAAMDRTEYEAAELLGLRPHHGIRLLFQPYRSECGVALRQITPAHAARTLRRLADTEAVDWGTPACAKCGTVDLDTAMCFGSSEPGKLRLDWLCPECAPEAVQS